MTTQPSETAEIAFGLNPNLTSALRYDFELARDIEAEATGPDGVATTLDMPSGDFRPWVAGQYVVALTNPTDEEVVTTLRLESSLNRNLALPYPNDLELAPQIVRELASPGLRLVRLDIPSGKSVALTLMVPAGLETLSYSIMSAQEEGLTFAIMAPDHRPLDRAAICSVHHGSVAFEHLGPHVLLLDNSTGATVRSVSLLVQTSGPSELLTPTPSPTATPTATARAGTPSSGTPSPTPPARSGTATPTQTPTATRTSTPTQIIAATPSLTTNTLSLPEFGIVGEHVREVTVPRSQGLRLLIPIDDRRVSRVQWWSESLRSVGAVRFQVMTPDGSLLDQGAVGLFNLGAFPISSPGSYSLLLENSTTSERVFRFSLNVSAR